MTRIHCPSLVLVRLLRRVESVRVVGRASWFCSPGRNETVVLLVASDGLRLMGDVWTQPRQSNHAVEMTKPSTGQTSEDGNNINRKLASVPRRLSVSRRGTRTIRFHWQHSPWLTLCLHSAERVMLSPPPPCCLCSVFLVFQGNANVFPRVFRDFCVAPLRIAHYKINTVDNLSCSGLTVIRLDFKPRSWR